jgi:hypothetical protein
LSEGGINIPPSPPPELDTISEVGTLEIARLRRISPVRNVDDADVARHPGYASYLEMIDGKKTTVWKGKGHATLVFDPDFETMPEAGRATQEEDLVISSLADCSTPTGLLGAPIPIPSNSPTPAIAVASAKTRALVEDSLHSAASTEAQILREREARRSIQRAKRIETVVNDISVKATSGAEWMRDHKQYVSRSHFNIEQRIKNFEAMMVKKFDDEVAHNVLGRLQERDHFTTRLFETTQPIVRDVSFHGFETSKRLSELGAQMIDARNEHENEAKATREFIDEELKVRFYSYHS